jgi:hypothetical protein
MSDPERATQRQAWDAILDALDGFVDAMDDERMLDDVPDIFHVVLTIEDKDSDRVYRSYPIRMAKRSRRAPKE